MKQLKLYVGGTFDLLHSGHINLLKHCKTMGEVIVSLNTDKFAEKYKRRPIMPLHERIAVLEACKYVDKVIINYGNEDSRPAILDSKCTHVVHGDEWEPNSLMKQMGLTQEWLDKHKVKMLYLPYTESVSTTWLLQRLASFVSQTEQAHQPT